MFSTLQHSTAQACLVDIAPPTGGVISSLTNNPDGSLKAQWTLATDPASPVSYEVYVQETTAVGLFAPANLIGVTRSLALDIYRDKNGDMVEAGRTYHVGVRAIDRVGNQTPTTTSLSIVAAGLGYANLLALLPGKVWDEPTAGHATAGTFGKLTADMKAGVDELLARLTLARAGLLDNLNFLDVAVSSRLSAAAYAAPDNAGISTLLGRLTNTRAVLLDNLALVDAAISTRASSAQAATINANVLLTESEADALNRFNALAAAIAGIPVVTPPSVGAIADAVWDEASAGHVAAGTFGLLVSLLELDSAAATRAAAILVAIGAIPVVTPPSASAIADAVWDEPLAGHLSAGSTGKKLNDGSALDAQGIRDAVWDAPLADHLDPNTTGAKLSEGTPIDPATIAEAVWDEPLADHLDVGSTGRKLSETFEASGFVPASQAIEVTFEQSPVEIEIQENQVEVIIQD